MSSAGPWWPTVTSGASLAFASSQSNCAGTEGMAWMLHVHSCAFDRSRKLQRHGSGFFCLEYDIARSNAEGIIIAHACVTYMNFCMVD